jgi:chemotaxis protein CheZ
MAYQADQIQQAVAATIRDEMGGLRTFVDRRIAELSAEIHATVQLVDFSETNLSGQLGEIRKQIAGVIALPTAATRNSGLELEAVVVQAPYNGAGVISAEASAANPDLAQDAVDSLFD